VTPGHAHGEPSAAAAPRLEVAPTNAPEEREADRLAEAATGVRRDAAPARPGGIAPPIVHEVLRSQGSPLAGDARAALERRAGADLSGIRVHRDERAAASARAVDAAAYTVGDHVVLGAGRYAPHTGQGRFVLAHEVAHVLQQRGAPGRRLARLDSQVVTSTPGPTDATLDRQPALDALRAWQGGGEALIDAAGVWQMRNWIDFLMRTSMNPRLSLQDGQLASIASNALGNAITTLGHEVIDGTAKVLAGVAARIVGAGIGSLVAPGPGTLIGYALGVLVEWGASWAFENITGKTDPAEAAADASLRTGELIDAQYMVQTQNTAVAKATLAELVRFSEEQTQAAATQIEVDRIRAWAERGTAEMPAPTPPVGLSLAEELLRIWALEHAADTTSARTGTDRVQWERAVEKSFGAGPRLDGHPELFAIQTAAEWSEAGLDPSDADAMLVRIRQIVPDAEDPASVVADEFHGRDFAFTSTTDPDALIAYVNDRGMYPMTQYGERAVREGKFKVTYTLDLATSRGSCYVDKWAFWISYLTPDFLPLFDDPWYNEAPVLPFKQIWIYP
jgi:hypothetical protein